MTAASRIPETSLEAPGLCQAHTDFTGAGRVGVFFPYPRAPHRDDRPVGFEPTHRDTMGEEVLGGRTMIPGEVPGDSGPRKQA